MKEPVFSPSDFVGAINQTLEFAYPAVTIVGELANYRVSKNRWVYFDLKDEAASVKFFGTVYQLSGPLEDGLLLQVRGTPRLHPLYGFSVSVQFLQPVGEGSLRRAASLLQIKLEAEGLFDPDRKRTLPFPPRSIGLVTSKESAAYADFIKVLNERWGGIDIHLADVQVQGEPAPRQIARAIEYFSSHSEPVNTIVIIRGGGSAEDLAAFSTEQVTRAVAASRIPTLAAIGHETDLSLAELAADERASTPSNAAELLVPDRRNALEVLGRQREQLWGAADFIITQQQSFIRDTFFDIGKTVDQLLTDAMRHLSERRKLLDALSPQTILRRGYALVTLGSHAVRSVKQVKRGDDLKIRLSDGQVDAEVQ